MKNLLFIVVCLFCILEGSAQESLKKISQVERIFELQDLATQAFSDRSQFHNGISYLKESIALYNQLDEKAQSNYLYLLTGDYYNMACFYSLLKQKKNALDAFDKAVNAGYKEYAHANTDSDLDYIRKERRFLKAMEKVKEAQEKSSFVNILKKDHAYRTNVEADMPEFVYEETTNWRIRNVREYFKLDSIAGDGDEISRIIRVLDWVHNLIPHDGNHFPTCELDAVDIYNYSKANNNKGVNCRALAIVLNECYLSLGIPSRFITCLPKDKNDYDCHVINAVYSESLDKWLWIDPTFNAYVKNGTGTLLSIEEVRDALIHDKPIFLNENANWNNQTPQTKEYYLDKYMAKNLYWFQCPVRSIFNVETMYRNTNEKYVSLIPVGHEAFGRVNTVITHDPAYFWQKPSLK